MKKSFPLFLMATLTASVLAAAPIPVPQHAVTTLRNREAQTKLAPAAAQRTPRAPRVLNPSAAPTSLLRPAAAVPADGQVRHALPASSRLRAPMAAPSDAAFYGYEVYNTSGAPLGLYQYGLDGSAQLLFELDPAAVPAPYGGAYILDGKYQYPTVQTYYGLYFIEEDYVSIDLTTGEVEVTVLPDDYNYVYYTAALNPIDGQVYAVGNYDGWLGMYRFGTLDLETYELTTIAIVTTESEPVYMSFTPDGQCYAFVHTEWGQQLISIDPATGDVAILADSEVPFSSMLTGAAIDPSTGLYSYHYLPDNDFDASVWYTVDPTTGAATECAYYPGPWMQAEIQGLAYDQDGAPTMGDPSLVPGAVTDLTLTLGADGLTASYTAPATTADGLTALSGPVEVQLGLTGPGSDVQLTVTDAAGAPAQHALPYAGAGKYLLMVTPLNEAGYGRTAVLNLWMGEDEAGAVRDLTATVADGQTVTLTWNVPIGQHGGEIDLTKVTYNVTRYRDGAATTVGEGLTGTSLTDELEITEFSKIQYEVATLSEGTVVATAKSNTLALGSFLPPVAFDMSTKDGFDNFTVLDANADGTTWSYNDWSQAAQYTYHTLNAADDWLLTPAIAVEAGYYYRIEFTDYALSSGYPERLEVKYGYGADVESMTGELVAAHTVRSEFDNPDVHTVAILADRSGTLHVGFHAISDADQLGLYVRDVTVSAPFTGAAPRPAENVTAAPEPTGALQAIIDLDAPSLSIDGDALTDLRIKIALGGQTVYDEPAAPGSHVSVAVPGEHTFNTYTVTAYTDGGESTPVRVSTMVGLEVPAAPEGVDFAAIEGGFHVEWQPVTKGVNGGAIGSEVTYKVTLIYSGVDYYEASVDGLTVTSFDWQDDFSTMGLVEFFVQAVNGEGESDLGRPIGPDGYDKTVLVGEPYELPIVEHFFDPMLGWPGFNTFWGVLYAGGGLSDWGIYGDSSDGDGSSMVFDNTMGAWYGIADSSILYTGVLNAADAAALAINYDVFMDPAFVLDANPWADLSGLRVAIYVSTDRTASWTLVESHSLAEFESAGFRSFRTDLSAYAGQPEMVVGIMGIDELGAYFLVDNIKIYQPAPIDAALTSITAPTRVEAPATFDVAVGLRNEGLNALSGLSVALYNGAELLQTQEPDLLLASGEAATVVFSVDATREGPDTFEFQAVLSCPGDESDDNNVSAVATTKVTKPALPTSELAATLSDDGTTAVLTWSVPDTTLHAMTYTETFESYTPFEIGDFGRWTVVDGDWGETFLFDDLTFPNAGQPFAWMVFNTDDAGYPYGGNPPATVSGAQMLISVCPADPYYGGASDWIVSPELTGEAQTVTFCISQFNDAYGTATYEVYYSTTGPDVYWDDFTMIGDVRTVEAVHDSYDLVSVDLPEGARHFAIRHVSEQLPGVMLDDVTFRTVMREYEGEILGYNVYRDGTKLNDVLITGEPTYTVALTADDAAYTVTIVYDKGESDPSNALTLSSGTMAIETLASDAAATGSAYDLYGRRVERPEAGQVYLRAGKAFMQK